MSIKVPLTELNSRMVRFRQQMDRQNPEWSYAAIFSKINLYYFTGTMQEGVLLIPRDDKAVLWVRRSYERAMEESFFADIRPMESYRDIAVPELLPDALYLEREFIPLAMWQRFQKYLPFKTAESADGAIAKVRAIKSLYELDLMEQSGAIHQRVLEQLAPTLLREGMSELDFLSELYHLLLQEGHQGVARFAMFDTELSIGQIGFGEASLYPTSFNGPGGNYGMSPAVPFHGNRNCKLSVGDLVFVDVPCGVEGYHTDKTMTYMFGRSIPEEAIRIHHQCVEIQNRVAEQLIPGAIPSAIYRSVMEGLSPEFLENFMGFGSRKVKFLGHGVGLTIDEIPVLANGFDDPIEAGMVFAVEPKKGIPGVGMVGIENTFLVTPGGGRSITGHHTGLLLV